MEKLLAAYSITEILVFIVVLALAIKGVITFYDWAVERLKRVFDKEYKATTDKQQLENRLHQGSETMDKLAKNQEEMAAVIQKLSDKIDMLIDSDKDDIKSFLTREHHYFCYQKGWIDDYSLECCERRYAHYKDEGGNSFIEGFMEELRKLPKVAPSNYSRDERI